MKRFLLTLFLMILCLPVEAKKEKSLVLTGGIEYTVETARKEAFDGIAYTIPLSMLAPHLEDPNYDSNKKATANRQEDLSDRWIERYSNGGYSIVYKKDRYKGYSYDLSGKLEVIRIRTSLNFPLKSYSYDLSGKLEGVSFYTRVDGKTHVFAYNPDGSFSHHWIDNKCYDKDGKLILRVIE